MLDETLRYLRERTSIHDDDVTIATSMLRYLDRSGSVVHERPQPYRYSGWHTEDGVLLGGLEFVRYHLGVEVSAFEPEGDAVGVSLGGDDAARVDLLVCADGGNWVVGPPRAAARRLARVRRVRGLARDGRRGAPGR